MSTTDKGERSTKKNLENSEILQHKQCITWGAEFSKVIFSAIKSSPSTMVLPQPKVPVPIILAGCKKSQQTKMFLSHIPTNSNEKKMIKKKKQMNNFDTHPLTLY